MTEPPRSTPSSRRVPFLASTAIVLLVVAAAAVIPVWLDDEPAPAPPDLAPVVALAEHDVCADRVVLYVRADAEMTRIAEAVRDDRRTRKVYTETQDEAHERLQRIYAGRPLPLSLSERESLPSSVSVVAAGRVDLREWADDLAAEFPGATVDPMIRAEIVRSLAASSLPSELEPCPTSGERD
ncbi:hypothetical protein [Prauserella cavernicola]|uniref:FtsX extracellular domain-containing protein n=1 Tax=Prauserella cavernicola TaxID=2800127 RepID=A0A934V4Q1_9PSEU|nr:hypothetical protein [Prauserella cavernicola]MBK1783823.1 hypothetical protein [Prauserella cavernicola]